MVLRILIAALVALLLFVVPAAAHDRSCHRNAQCRLDKTTIEVRYHGFVTYGRGVSWTHVRTGRWGQHSWRGVFSYGQYNSRIVCRGSVIMSAHTGHALRWREVCA